MPTHINWYRQGVSLGFPLLLILVGTIWLGRVYGWIPGDVPLIPWILVGLGVWILLTRLLAQAVGR